MSGHKPRENTKPVTQGQQHSPSRCISTKSKQEEREKREQESLSFLLRK